MVRAPCCEKMGLKKGPWTHEEDQVLINYINSYGHSNWRALPKQAGLLRCGKSCRLRWTNYLRPDIKRGNFSIEEEETIIKLHEMLGNRWSAMATRLPGRTDNEIKNVWHTHLKKRLKPINNASKHDKSGKFTENVSVSECSSTEISSMSLNDNSYDRKSESPNIFLQIDDVNDFWSELLMDGSSNSHEFASSSFLESEGYGFNWNTIYS